MFRRVSGRSVLRFLACLGKGLLWCLLYGLWYLAVWLIAPDSFGLEVDFICSGTFAAFLFLLRFRESSSGKRLSAQEWYGGMSIFGWSSLLMLFLLMYIFSEIVGTYLMVAFPDVGATGVYTDMTDTMLAAYILMSVTVAPLCEELVFRWAVFSHARRSIGFWPSYIISAVLFTAMHGTLMHIPVTMALSLFVSILYEVTGNFLYCVVFHSLFNWMGCTIIFSIDNFPVWARFLGYAIVFACVVSLYVFRELLFGKIFRKGGLACFEAYLDEKRKHLADDSPGYGPVDDLSDDKPSGT